MSICCWNDGVVTRHRMLNDEAVSLFKSLEVCRFIQDIKAITSNVCMCKNTSIQNALKKIHANLLKIHIHSRYKYNTVIWYSLGCNEPD